MQVRGAPLIGVTAAYGMALAMAADPGDGALRDAAKRLFATRPTAVNLSWAIERLVRLVLPLERKQRAAAAFAEADAMAEEDADICRRIGEHGLALIEEAAHGNNGPVNVLTHCNAGWLAAIEWGTATAPIYLAHERGIDIHVWVDETRPRNQGAGLTAWELGQAGVPHTVIVDNAGGHLMQQGKVDLCMTGTDRTTARGDVCNKIGTYLKALAAYDNGVPFYVALPGPTIDWSLKDGVRDVPIEERDGREVSHVWGRTDDGRLETVAVVAPGSAVANPAFDVTPARLVTGLITERGVCAASRDGLLSLYPEARAA
jgi:methylthioribose-1-phosphate isomerase